MHSGVVDEKSVLVFTVFSQRLAVIAERDDERRIIKMILLEPSDQVAEFMIGVGNRAIVGMAAVFGAVGLRRFIRAVRIVKMQPEKKRSPRSFLQPCDGIGYALPGGTVDQAGFFFLEGLGRKRIIIKIEAAGQSPTSVEHERTDHGSGGVACLLESLGHGAKLLCQRLSGEILDAVLKRIGTGQDHGM